MLQRTITAITCLILFSFLASAQKEVPQRPYINEEEAPLPLNYEVPIIFFMGLYDLHTPYETAKEFMEEIKAPYKQFITFKYSSHFIMFEEPEKLLQAINEQFLPFTK